LEYFIFLNIKIDSFMTVLTDVFLFANGFLWFNSNTISYFIQFETYDPALGLF